MDLLDGVIRSYDWGSATALADAIPEAQRMTLAAGHISMMAGSRASAMHYKPLTKWLKETLGEIN